MHCDVRNLSSFFILLVLKVHISEKLKIFCEYISWPTEMFADISRTLLCLKSLLRTTLDIEIPGNSHSPPGVHLTIYLNLLQFNLNDLHFNSF